MAQVWENGLIKQGDDGEFSVVETPQERLQLKLERSKRKPRGNIEPVHYDDASVDPDIQEGDLE